MEDSEVYRLLEGRVTYATETHGHKIYYVLPHEPEESQDAEAGLREGFRLFHVGRRRCTAHPTTSTRCVLLLGETGAGKTTLVNAQLNYLYGVKFDDPFRLQVEERIEDSRLETDGRTDFITVYTVHYQEGMKHAYNFVLIDTPGLADTRGAEQQQLIMRRLKVLFTSEFGVSDLHCLAIVTKGNTNRRVEHQRNLLAEITTLLGKYVPHITHVFATHALESEVSADDVVSDCGIAFQSTFKFDNGSLLCPKETDEAWDPRKRWKIMTEQYDAFFGALITAPAVSIEILRERKLFDTSKKNLKELVELSATAMVTNYDTKTSYEKYTSLEEENRGWWHQEIVESIGEEVLDNPTHAHNCKTCKQTCKTCQKRMCKVIFPSALSTALTVGSAGSFAVVPIATTTAVATAVVPVIGGAIALATGLASFGIIKGVGMIKGKAKCTYNDCQHQLSEHFIERIQRTKIIKENKIIDEGMKKKFEEAVSKKKEASIKLIEGEQKLMSTRNKLSKSTVELLYHAKRIHEIDSQDFDYIEDIHCYLDGLQQKDNCSTDAVNSVVHVLKEAMQQLDSCGAEQVRGNPGLVEELLSAVTVHGDVL